MKKRTGFSLIELGVAIVVMLVISGVIYKSLTGFKQKQTINAGVEKDIATILMAAEEYKDMDPTADNTYNGLDAGKLEPYLPTKMTLSGSNVTSMTFKDGCLYNVVPSATPFLKYTLLINCEGAATGQNWDDRQRKQLQNVVKSTIAKNVSTDNFTIEGGTFTAGTTTSFSAVNGATDVGFKISNLTR